MNVFIASVCAPMCDCPMACVRGISCSMQCASVVMTAKHWCMVHAIILNEAHPQSGPLECVCVLHVLAAVVCGGEEVYVCV